MTKNLPKSLKGPNLLRISPGPRGSMAVLKGSMMICRLRHLLITRSFKIFTWDRTLILKASLLLNFHLLVWSSDYYIYINYIKWRKKNLSNQLTPPALKRRRTLSPAFPRTSKLSWPPSWVFSVSVSGACWCSSMREACTSIESRITGRCTSIWAWLC